jgi:hypothetical protein
MTDGQATRQDPHDAMAHVENLVAELVALYGQLDALSQRQTELVGGASLDPLLDVLSERQPIVDRIDAVTGELGPILADREAVLAAAGPGAGELRLRLAGVEQMAEAINARDERDRAALMQRRQSVSDELAGIGTARAANRAYGGPSDTRPRLQDRRG